jgi:hypothetical protein
MIIKARNSRISYDRNEEADEEELKLNDFDHVDETLSTESIITTF